MASRGARPGMWRTLAASLCAIVVLIVLAEVFSFSTSLRTQDEVHRLVREGERSTFLIGDLGRHAARLHSNLLELQSAAAEQRGEIRARIERITEQMEAHARDLPGLLSASELEVWASIDPALEALTRLSREILAAVDAGRAADIQLETAEVADLKRQVLDWLETSMELNQNETKVMLERTDQLIERARVLELVVALLLFVSIAAVALLAVRDLRRKERELASYLRQVEDTNSDLDAFAGRIAHDLRSTLGTMHLAGHVLRASPSDPEVVAATGARIERTSRHANEMIESLLAFARAGAPSDAAWAELDGALDRVLEELAPTCERLDVTVHREVEPDLVVRCGPALLHVLLSNVLANAVKFLEGRPERIVRIRARASDAECHVEVSDTGPGIPSALLGRIFEPFFRVPGTTSVGQGIGLATALRIVEGHGGQIRVRSEEGRGSTFLTVLPLHDVLQPHRPDSGAGHGQEAGQRPARR